MKRYLAFLMIFCFSFNCFGMEEIRVKEQSSKESKKENEEYNNPTRVVEPDDDNNTQYDAKKYKINFGGNPVDNVNIGLNIDIDQKKPAKPEHPLMKQIISHTLNGIAAGASQTTGQLLVQLVVQHGSDFYKYISPNPQEVVVKEQELGSIKQAALTQLKNLFDKNKQFIGTLPIDQKIKNQLLAENQQKLAEILSSDYQAQKNEKATCEDLRKANNILSNNIIVISNIMDECNKAKTKEEKEFWQKRFIQEQLSFHEQLVKSAKQEENQFKKVLSKSTPYVACVAGGVATGVAGTVGLLAMLAPK
ncbi:MAG: hypothetical protein WDZ41_00865 [Candidatus Babeliales bacterium]